MATTPQPPVEACTCCGPFREHIKNGAHVAIALPWQIVLAICEFCDNRWHRTDISTSKWRHASADEAEEIKRRHPHLWHTLRGHKKATADILAMELVESDADSQEEDRILTFVRPPAA